MPLKKAEMPKRNTSSSAAPVLARRKLRSREELMPQIVLAAAEEFKQLGYAEAKMASIAQKAGVTETQLFRYFGSKSNLFRDTIFHPLADHLTEFIERQMPDTMPHGYTAEIQQFVRDNADMLRSLVAIETYGNGEVQGVGQVDSLKTYFERGEATLWKWSAESPQVDPKLMVRISFVAILACVLFKDWIFPPGLASEDEISAAIDDFVRDGVNVVKQPRGI